MSILAIGVLAVTAAVFILTLRPKNGEIALLLGLACSAVILLRAMGEVSGIAHQLNSILAASQISGDYLAILLRVVGICLVTEFTVSVCRDAGSSALASNVSLAGKLMATAVSLPLYSEILNTVLSLTSNGMT